MKAIAIDLLLAVSVLIMLLSVLGMWRMRDPYQRMHYISPPAAFTPLLISIAILLQNGLKPEFFKAIVITLVLIGMNTVVTHAAARAFRIAETRNWRPAPGEEVPIHASDELVKPEAKS
jgi:multicomponent Na+:H+ antiporter subunit G